MNTRRKTPALIVITLLLLFSAPGAGYAAVEPGGGSPAPTSETQTPDANPEVFSRTGKYWSFENYAFSFALPEALEGHFYPDPRMTHGVVFPLGPEKKPEERRELLVWAHYNTLDDNEEDYRREHRKDSAAWLKKLDAALDEQNIHSYSTVKAGMRFHCYALHGESIRYVQSIVFGAEGSIIYELSLLTTKEAWDQDYPLFQRVLETFRTEATP